MTDYNTADDYVVNESELADAARLEGVTPEIVDVLYSCDNFYDDPAAPVVTPKERSAQVAADVGDGSSSLTAGHVEPPPPKSDPYADFFAQRRFPALPRYETTDLLHTIERPDQRRQQMAEWQAHLNDGWETVNITVLLDKDGKLTRVITMKRECPPVPARPDPLMAAAILATAQTAQMDTHLNAPTIIFHPPITLTPQERPANPILAKLLADHPIAAHVHEHGVEATLEAMNSRVRDSARAAYDQRKALWDNKGRPITPIPLLPPRS